MKNFFILPVFFIFLLLPSIVYAESEVKLETMPKEARYWDDITITASLSSYDKPDELRYMIDVFDPDGKLIDSTLWFARQDHISVIPTEHPAYKITKIGEYRVVIEKAHTVERTGEIITTDSFIITTYPPPQKQTNAGVDPESVNCNEGLVLIFKQHTNSPICVTLSTEEKLIERGWAIK